MTPSTHVPSRKTSYPGPFGSRVNDTQRKRGSTHDGARYPCSTKWSSETKTTNTREFEKARIPQFTLTKDPGGKPVRLWLFPRVPGKSCRVRLLMAWS